MIHWHRLFGVALTDFFEGSPFTVELERDLSIRRQLIDVILIRRTPGTWDRELPDGLDDLADHNLVSYKSMREPLDDWTLKELTGHYVNYRKQLALPNEEMLPEERFRLYGVCTRFPEKLSGQTRLDKHLDGVYEVARGTDRIRLIVLSEIDEAPRNRLWRLFSGVTERVQRAAREAPTHMGRASTILNWLLEFYKAEGATMPYTLEDFDRDTREHVLSKMTPKEILEYISMEDILKGLPTEDILKSLPPEERLKGLPPEERLKGLPPEERLKGLSEEVIREYLEKLSKH